MPELPPGSPLHALMTALHRLHARAGWPSTRVIANKRGEVGVSHTTVHAMFTRPELPKWPVLCAVVERLADLAPLVDVDKTRLEFDQLWDKALDSVEAGAAPPATDRKDRGEHRSRFQDLLATHPNLIVTDNGALMRRNELLVLPPQADAVHDAARRWVESREDLLGLGITRLRLRASAGVHVPALAFDLRGGSRGHRRSSTTPNHVMMGVPAHWSDGPFGPPTPAKALPAPDIDPDRHSKVIGILDTGVSRHPWFDRWPWLAEDVGDIKLFPQAGHGTFVAGIILSRAPNTFLRIERALRPDGVTDEVRLRSHLSVFASLPGPDIINMSFGGYTFDDGPSPILIDAFAHLPRKTVVVAAAGDHGSDQPFWPAALPDVVAVGALAAGPDGPGRERAGFSNFGSWATTFAPGDRVTSTFPTTEDMPSGFATWSGTSFAAPWVTGSLAALMADRGLSAKEAVTALLEPANGPDLAD